MLCTKLRQNEEVRIGPIRIVVLDARNGSSRLGIDIPPQLLAQLKALGDPDNPPQPRPGAPTAAGLT